MSANHSITLSKEEESQLRGNLKRCRPEVIEAAVDYRSTGNAQNLSTIVLGIIERFLEPEVRPRFQEKNASELHLMNDLGADSLIIVEIIVTIEETLLLSIPNEEIIQLKTIGDVDKYIQNKIHAARNQQNSSGI